MDAQRLWFGNRQGVILLSVSLILMGIAVVGIAMLTNNRLATAAASNYKKRIQSFYASDGLMTKLAQEMIDGQADKYLQKFASVDIGVSGTPAGRFGVDSLRDLDTVYGRGNTIGGTADACHFAYASVTGAFDFIVQVREAGAAGTEGRVGIMVRENLVPGSKGANVLLNPQAGSVVFARRLVLNGSTTVAATANSVSAPAWLRLIRKSSTLEAYWSSSGSVWYKIGTPITLSLTNALYVGLAVSSGVSGTLSKAIFTNLSGIPVRYGTDTVQVSNFAVSYKIAEIASGLFDMSTLSYLQLGGGEDGFTTPLMQRIASGKSEAYADTVNMPVTCYDYPMGKAFDAASGHPDLGPKAWGRPYPMPRHLVRSRLGADGYPVPDSVFFSATMSKWWKPWNPSDPDRWKRPYYDNSDGTLAGWDTVTYDTSYKNYEITGTVPFTRDLSDPSGQTYSYENKQFYKFLIGKGFNLTDSIRNTIGPGWAKWMGWDTTGWEPCSTTDWSAVASCIGAGPQPNNFVFTTKIKSVFVYKPGLRFKFKGDDWVYVFVDSTLMLDLKAKEVGIDSFNVDDVFLEKGGRVLVDGRLYSLDFFHVDLCPCGAAFSITTNMIIWTPPTPRQRSWKRDYGNLD